jgi:hypothetical protein
LQHSRNPVGDSIEEAFAAAGDAGGEGLHCAIPQFTEVKVVFGKYQDGGHDVGEDNILRLFDKISDIGVIAKQPLVSFLHPLQVLGPNCIPEFQGEGGVLVALVDMLYCDLREVHDEISEHVVAMFSELEQKLIDLLLEFSPEDGQDELEDLVAVGFVIEDVPQEGDAFPQRAHRYFRDSAALPQADQQASQYLLAGLLVDQRFHIF